MPGIADIPYKEARVVVLKKKNGSRVYKEEVYLAYSIAQLHLNHLIA